MAIRNRPDAAGRSNVTKRCRRETALPELAAREQELSAIYKNSPGILFYVSVEPDGEFRFQSMSHAGLLAMGLTREQVVGRPVREVIPSPSRDLVLNCYREAIRSGQTVKWKEISKYPAGRKVGEVAVTPLYDARGVATHLIGIVHDITERERLEEALQGLYEAAHNRELKLLLETSTQGILSVDKNGVIVTANHALEVMFGWPPGELIGKPLEQLLPAVRRERHEQHRTDYFATPHPRLMGGGLELVGERTDGSTFPIEVSLNHVLTSEGPRAFAFVTDITERKLAEENLRKSEERFRLAAQAAKMFAFEWDMSTDVVLRSAESTPLLERDEPRETTGQQVLSRVHQDDRVTVSAALAALRRENPTYHVSYRSIRPSGNLIWAEAHGVAHFDDSGKLLRIIGMATDITERKLAEESHARLAAIVESSEDAIISKTLDGIITSWNKGAQRLFGYTSEEAIGRPITTIIPPELRDEERTILAKLRSGERVEHFETIRVTKEGRNINVSLSISPIRDAAGKVVGASKIARDITERKSAERELTDVRRRLASAQEEERARMGRELHDDINQRLAVLAIEVDQLQIQSPKSAVERSRGLAQLKQRLIEVSHGVQSLSHQLHPSQLQYLGLVGAMKGLCRDFSEGRTNVDFTADYVPKDVPHDLSLSLFRVLQEAVHNAAKHGKAPQIKVNLSSSSSELQLTISDNGKGFDPNKATTHGGLGLVSMRERIRLVGGTTTIDSARGSGTTIRVTAPLPQRAPFT